MGKTVSKSPAFGNLLTTVMVLEWDTMKEKAEYNYFKNLHYVS